MKNVRDAATVLWYAAVVTWYAGLVGGFVGIFWLWGNGDTPFFKAAGEGAGVAAAAALACWALWAGADASKQRRAAEESARARQAADAKALAEQRAEGRRQILANATRAVEQLEALPRHMTAAKANTERAAACFADGAFSPFWSAIEAAYGDLGQYAQAVQTIDSLAKSHAGLVSHLVRTGGNPGALAEFPVHLERSRVEKQLADATQDLSRRVYEAQKVPVFAQIWEQRRTTAAVIAGFANLEQAVNRMGATITSSLSSMEASLVQSGREVHAQLDRMASSGEAASHQQVAALSALNARAERIHNEVYRQNWGVYPVL